MNANPDHFGRAVLKPLITAIVRVDSLIDVSGLSDIQHIKSPVRFDGNDGVDCGVVFEIGISQWKARKRESTNCKFDRSASHVSGSF